MRSSSRKLVGLVLPGLFAVACSQESPSTPTAPLSAALAVETASQSSAVAHSVTGSATVSEDGVLFRSSIAAHSAGSGSAWGTVEIPLDLRAFGLGKLTFGGQVACLDVDGNSAWIGARIDHSTNGDLIPAGLTTITLVRDLGRNGEDVMHSELFESDVRCTDRPALIESVVDRGNYTVR